ncbi:MAG: winged helix-turn-helix transcriptional regulator [Mycobacteriales bacterium]
MSYPPHGAPPEPLSQLVELLARRHTLALVWSLRSGPAPFKALAQTVHSTESITSQRLRELRAAGLVGIDERGDYRLADSGRRLLGVLDQLVRYCEDWDSQGPRQRVPRGSPERGRGEP